MLIASCVYVVWRRARPQCRDTEHCCVCVLMFMNARHTNVISDQEWFTDEICGNLLRFRPDKLICVCVWYDAVALVSVQLYSAWAAKTLTYVARSVNQRFCFRAHILKSFVCLLQGSRMNVETLSKAELLMLLSILEGELEAQDVVIHTLRVRAHTHTCMHL